MTCHTIGSQMLIIGGLALGREVEERITCNKRLVNILDMNNPNGVFYLLVQGLGMNIAD
jgi:hypothetical protein